MFNGPPAYSNLHGFLHRLEDGGEDEDVFARPCRRPRLHRRSAAAATRTVRAIIEREDISRWSIGGLRTFESSQRTYTYSYLCIDSLERYMCVN